MEFVFRYIDTEWANPSGKPIHLKFPEFWYGGYNDSKGNFYHSDDYYEYMNMIFKDYDKKGTKLILVGHNVDYDILNLIAFGNMMADITGKGRKIQKDPKDKYGKSKRGQKWTLYTAQIHELYLDNNTSPIFIVDSRGLMSGALSKYNTRDNETKGETPIIDKARTPTESELDYLRVDCKLLQHNFQDLGGEEHISKGYSTQASVANRSFKNALSQIDADFKYKDPGLKRRFGGNTEKKPPEKIPKDVSNKVEKVLDMILAEHKKNSKGLFGVSKETVENLRKKLTRYVFKHRKDSAKTIFSDYKYEGILLKSQEFALLSSINKDLRSAMRGGISYVNPTYKDKLLGNGCSIDFNSMYPSLLLAYKIPIDYIGTSYDGIVDFNSYFVAEIKTLKATLKEGKHPFIKGNTIVTNDLVYEHELDWVGETNKDGYITRTLASVEIEYMYEVYDVHEIEYGRVHYFSTNDNFDKAKDRHLQYWRKVKESIEDKNLPDYNNAKLMLNSLWGRWGMYDKKVKNGGVRVDIGDKDTNLISAVFTTVFARITLNRIMNVVGDNLVYTDTDSVHIVYDEKIKNFDDVVELLGKEMFHDSEFGKWSLDVVFTQARYIKAKTYAYVVNEVLKMTTAGSTIDPDYVENVEKFKSGLKYKTLESEIEPTYGFILIDKVTKTL